MGEIQRVFIPGSKWFYIKLYTGVSSADSILINEVLQTINTLFAKKIIDKWFFIRYSDPDFHLRIRILLKDESRIREVIDFFYSQLDNLVKSNSIWKVQIDTYSRELERYGNELIEESESIFYADSECVVSIIQYLIDLKDEKYRWMIALRMIDNLLTDFSLDLVSKQQLMHQLNTSFKHEFGFNQFNAKQFNIKYRENKKDIELILNNKKQTLELLELSLPIKKRSRQMESIIKTLYIKLDKQDLNHTINSFLTSYVHMMLNRLFRSRNRMHELVLYDFMDRYYISEIAKSKHNPNKETIR